MAMHNLKKRITIVKTTAKITNAMKLMASGKLQKYKTQYLTVHDFYAEFYNCFGHLIHMYQPQVPAVSKTLHLIITSHLGLCGGYNINVLKQAIPQIKATDFVIHLGKRGREAILSNLKPGQFIDFNYWEDMQLKAVLSTTKVAAINYWECEMLSAYIVSLLATKKIDSVRLHYTKFVNAITFTPTSLSVLPFDEEFTKANAANAWNKDLIDFEPQLEEMMQKVIPSYLSAVFYASLLESNISENASRRNAMNSATDNANELIGKLIIHYNRERQAKITNEITEIIAGSENS